LNLVNELVFSIVQKSCGFIASAENAILNLGMVLMAAILIFHLLQSGRGRRQVDILLILQKQETTILVFLVSEM
jgi:hypothetical protein